MKEGFLESSFNVQREFPFWNYKLAHLMSRPYKNCAKIGHKGNKKEKIHSLINLLESHCQLLVQLGMRPKNEIFYQRAVQ